MAAFDTPWMMSSAPSISRRSDESAPGATNDPNPPTVASFSPVTLAHASSVNKQRSTILVHQKSPLLIATPPQITRALAYSHPFLLPLNKLLGLVTWTSGDPWESFLLVAGFWGFVLYGDVIMRYGGPLVVVFGLIFGMYLRRYSPLSSSGWGGEMQKKGHKRMDSEATNMKHQKTLDEIVETLKIFTSRCNVLLDPLLELTDFLSTQRTATSATTRPALTTLLIRILLMSPVWVLFTLKPIAIITTKRISLVTGTIFLTWYSRPATVSREILWRSATIRKFCTLVTGLHFTDALAPQPQEDKDKDAPDLPLRPQKEYAKRTRLSVASIKRRPDAAGVKFTFILYENQRRWLGLGWTSSVFAYERAAWTDEHLNPAPAKDEFELPDVEGGASRWRWVEGSQWLVEGAAETDEGGSKAKSDSTDGGQGWIYYDSKWQNGRRGQDGWGRYTRRRKWYRDAELVEVTPSTEPTPVPSPARDTNTTLPSPSKTQPITIPSLASKSSERSSHSSSVTSEAPSLPPRPIAEDNTISVGSLTKSDRESLKSYSQRPATVRRRGTGATSGSAEGRTSRRSSFSNHTNSEADVRVRQSDWGIGDDASMSLE